MRILKVFTLFLSLVALHSCRGVRDVAYFQEGQQAASEKKVVYPNFNLDRNKTAPVYENLIQTSDILSIYVSSLSPEASSFFNAIAPLERNEQTTNSSFSTRTDIGYLVDAQGYIEMPLIGKVKMAGLTTSIAKDTLTQRLEKFLQYPSVRIYIENYRVTILGEVNRPGVYSVTNEKITIPEALGLAGDLNIFADRKNITLIREENGDKKYTEIDLTSRQLFNEPYYYLRSGDILYISPVKGRVAQSDNVYRVLPLVMSSLTLVAVVVARIIQ
ncbi:MAG: polysaccharide biosynthesis/export family protein [Bacteroidia bacterium]|nr:polysaccharide biosynthesis/export family protein [Bacteroidia bacterium]